MQIYYIHWKRLIILMINLYVLISIILYPICYIVSVPTFAWLLKKNFYIYFYSFMNLSKKLNNILITKY